MHGSNAVESDLRAKRPKIRGHAGGTRVAPLTVSSAMAPMSLSVNEGFDRLQRMLLAMGIGDQVRPGDASDESGLSPEICLAVLVGLERAGLMSRGDEDRFVRRRLDLNLGT